MGVVCACGDAVDACNGHASRRNEYSIQVYYVVQRVLRAMIGARQSLITCEMIRRLVDGRQRHCKVAALCPLKACGRRCRRARSRADGSGAR